MRFHGRNDWQTPDWLFRRFDNQFGFTVDAAAHEQNHKLNRYWDRQADGLAQDWTRERIWCNPPYGAGIGGWVNKAIKDDALAVLLLPVRTEMDWWSRCVKHSSEILFAQGRVHFKLPGFSDPKGSRPVFASVVVVFRPGPAPIAPLVSTFPTPRVTDRLRQTSFLELLETSA